MAAAEAFPVKIVHSQILWTDGLHLIEVFETRTHHFRRNLHLLLQNFDHVRDGHRISEAQIEHFVAGARLVFDGRQNAVGDVIDVSEVP